LRFFDTELFASLPEAEKVRLKAQHCYMAGYLEILDQRIAEFTRPAD
jgi:hypothetical protein